MEKRVANIEDSIESVNSTVKREVNLRDENENNSIPESSI